MQVVYQLAVRVRTRTVHHNYYSNNNLVQRCCARSAFIISSVHVHPIPVIAGNCSGAQTLFGHSSISKARRTVSPSRRNNVSIHLSFLKSRPRRSCGARYSSLVKVSSSNLAFTTVDYSHAVRVHKLPSYSSAHSLDYAHTESLICLSSRIYYG